MQQVPHCCFFRNAACDLWFFNCS